jgi:hypothetical protein
MRLVAQLSNPPNQWTLTVLGAVPDELPIPSAIQGPKPKRASPRAGNAFVLRAVVAVLRDGQPRSVREVRAAIEQALGEPVSIHSVNWCLSTGSRKHPLRFERVARGVYRIRPQT